MNAGGDGRDMKAMVVKWKAEADAPLREIARPISEWHEDMGDVLWWSFPIEEPPYVGSPLDCGQNVKVTVGDNEFVACIGGWPGYHTHWTSIRIPESP